MKIFENKVINAKWLVKFLVHTYFTNLHSVLIVYDSKNLSPTKLEYFEGLKNAIKEPQNSEQFILHWIDVANLNEQQFFRIFLQNVELGCEGYISLLPNTSYFISAKYYATERSVLRLKDTVFLFLSEREDPRSVLKHNNLQWYPNHLLVTASRGGSFNFWTQKFVGVENNEEAVLLNTLYPNCSFAKNATLFPEKLKNGYGREMKISALTYIPYVVSKFVVEGQGNVDSVSSVLRRNVIYDGSEAYIMLEFCKLRNYTPKVQLHGNDEWGGIYDNGSSDGMIGSVYRKEAEIGIGCYYNWHNEEFETSVAIAKSAVTLLSPAPLKYPPSLTPLLPFTCEVWIFILITLVLSSFTLYGIRFFAFSFMKRGYDARYHRHKSYAISLLETVAIFLQQSFATPNLDNLLTTRLLLAALLIAGVTLENAYSGNLKSMLTIPFYMDPIDTAQKFADSNLKWGAPAPAWVLSISTSHIAFEKKLFKNFEIRQYNELRNLSFSRNYGLAVERLHSGSYSFGTYIQEDAINYFILLRDDIFFEYTRAFSIRGWPLMEHLNMFILWTLEHGLFHIWERRAVARYLATTTQNALLTLASGYKKNSAPEVLNISHVSGHLCILVIGYIVAFIAFVLEVLVDKWKRRTNLQQR